MNAKEGNLLTFLNSGTFIKYAISLVLIALFSRLYLYKQLKRLFNKLRNKGSKLKYLIESDKTNSLDLCIICFKFFSHIFTKELKT